MNIPIGLALSRATHPQTSHEAADEFKPELRKMQLKVLSYVFAYPDRTANELAAIYQERDPRRIGRRLPELERLGEIDRGAPRRCEITGKSAHTWRLTKQREA